MEILKKLSQRNKDAFNAPAVTIACLGDSVTHGCFEVFINRFGSIDTIYRPTDGYVGQLKRALDLLYPAGAVSVLNAGISGDNAINGEKRLERDVLCHHPDLVIVNFGLNDAMGGISSLSDYAEAMDGIMKRVLDSGAECLLLTPNRMCAYAANTIHDDEIKDIAAAAANVQNGGTLDAFVEKAREIAQKNDVPIADAYARWNRLEAFGVNTTSLLCNDINHPSPEAHRLFVEEILKQMLA